MSFTRMSCGCNIDAHCNVWQGQCKEGHGARGSLEHRANGCLAYKPSRKPLTSSDWPPCACGALRSEHSPSYR